MVSGAVEETLRFRAPVLTMPWVARQEVDLGELARVDHGPLEPVKGLIAHGVQRLPVRF